MFDLQEKKASIQNKQETGIVQKSARKISNWIGNEETGLIEKNRIVNRGKRDQWGQEGKEKELG